MVDPGQRAFAHLLRAFEELVLALASGASLLAGNAATLEQVRAALRAEEKRWADRAARDPHAERVREIFAALSDAIAASSQSRSASGKSGFDRPRVRWDTRRRWRS